MTKCQWEKNNELYPLIIQVLDKNEKWLEVYFDVVVGYYYYYYELEFVYYFQNHTILIASWKDEWEYWMVLNHDEEYDWNEESEFLCNYNIYNIYKINKMFINPH